MNKTITPDDLERLLRSTTPHALIDLRERATYERGHIYRATSVPRRLLEFRMPALVTARATPIVVYDEDGALAAAALPTLSAMGYTDVRTLAGGLPAWRASGRRAVQGINVPSKVFGERVLHECKTPEVKPAELQERIDRREDMVIVDSRTPEEYHRGCIPGAVSMPGAELSRRGIAATHEPAQPDHRARERHHGLAARGPRARARRRALGAADLGGRPRESRCRRRADRVRGRHPVRHGGRAPAAREPA